MTVSQNDNGLLISLYLEMDDRDLDEEAMLNPESIADYKYLSYKKVLQEYGRFFDIIENDIYPLKVKQRDPASRWVTALKLSTDELIYTEGVVVLPTKGLPFSSSWLTDRKTGKVVDPTFYDYGVMYFGISFNREFAIQHAKDAGQVGILITDKGIGANILRNGLPPNSIWMPD